MISWKKECCFSKMDNNIHNAIVGGVNYGSFEKMTQVENWMRNSELDLINAATTLLCRKNEPLLQA